MGGVTRQKTNINNIVDNALCSACGACAGICPVKAIKMHMQVSGFITAVIDSEKCINCGMCHNVCPSNGKRNDCDLVGEMIAGYIGYATEYSVRKNGQSGGVVTAILQYLFEKQLIDGAVVARFNCKDKKAENFLALSVEDVCAASGSHYTQTSPVEMILANQDKRLAAVLLGCQAESLQQIKEKYPNIKLPLYTIGLICGGNNSSHIVDDLLSIGGYDRNEELRSFTFRDKNHGGWPGNIAFRTEKLHQVPKEKRMELKPHYQNYRCLVCADKMNLHCDIVVGDPWGISLEEEHLGYSAVITRTENGEKLVNDAINDGKIFLENHSAEEIVVGQQIQTELKKRHDATQRITMRQGWKSSYRLMENREKASSTEFDKYILKKMKYTRELYLCKDVDQVKKMISKNKKKLSGSIREILYKIKKLILK